MKRCFLLCIAVCWCIPWVCAQRGRSCDYPIVVKHHYNGHVNANTTTWFTATTWDLPLSIEFIPDSFAVNIYTVEDDLPSYTMDFKCPNAQYDSLAQIVVDYAYGIIALPIEELWIPYNKDTTELISDDYRYYEGWDKDSLLFYVDFKLADAFMVTGLPQEIPAYFSLTTPIAGQFIIKSRSEFADCDNKVQRVYRGDTIHYEQGNNQIYYFVPDGEDLVDNTRDGLNIYWSGLDTLHFYKGAHCDSVFADSAYWFAAKPNMTTLAMDSMTLNSWARGESRFLFFRMEGNEDGDVIFLSQNDEIETQESCRTLTMVYPFGITIDILPMTDTIATYQWKIVDWLSRDVQFTWNNSAPMTMYVSDTCDFSIDSADKHIVGTYKFMYTSDSLSRVCNLSRTELSKMIAQSQDKRLYVRFISAKAGKISSKKWNITDCLAKSTMIRSTDTLYLLANKSSDIYRVDVHEWLGDTIEVSWSGAKTNTIYFADDCNFRLSSGNIHVVQRVPVVSNNSVELIPTDNWVERQTEEGYLYVRFSNSTAGVLAFNSYRGKRGPEPEPQPKPIFTSTTIALECKGADVVVKVSHEQDIVLRDNTGETIKSWHQLAGDSNVYTLTSLAQGVYMLQGEHESVQLVIN